MEQHRGTNLLPDIPACEDVRSWTVTQTDSFTVGFVFTVQKQH